MPQSPEVDFIVSDDSNIIGGGPGGIIFVLGKFQRGPINDPSDIIASSGDFVAKYGAYVPGNGDDPLMVERLLDNGAQLRISRQAHYTTITDPTTLSAVVGNISNQTTPPASKRLTFNADLVAGNNIAMDTLGSDSGSGGFSVNFAISNDFAMRGIGSNLVSGSFTEIQSISYGPSPIRYISIILKPGKTFTISNILVTGGSSQATGVYSSISGSTNTIINSSGETLFNVVPKYPGADYNNLVLTIEVASNGVVGYFNMRESYKSGTGGIPDVVYQNLKIDGKLTIKQLTFLQGPINGSNWFNYSYVDTTALSGNVYPEADIYHIVNGSDGGAIIDADIIGNVESLTGFHSFDAYQDSLIIASVGSTSATVVEGGAAYADLRSDLVYFSHLDNSYISQSQLSAARTAITVDTSSAAFFAGGLKIIDPVTGANYNTSELGDVLGLYSKSFKQNGPWESVSNAKRATLKNALGVVNNFGSSAAKADLNALANNQINMVITRNGKTMIWGNFTAQSKSTLLSFLKIKFTVLQIIKDITPTIESYLEEPMVPIPTFKNLFDDLFPYFENLKSPNVSALYDYTWEGDQDAKTIKDCKLNTNPNDLALGNYKINLTLFPINSIQNITVNISISKTSGVSTQITSN